MHAPAGMHPSAVYVVCTARVVCVHGPEAFTPVSASAANGAMSHWQRHVWQHRSLHSLSNHGLKPGRRGCCWRAPAGAKAARGR